MSSKQAIITEENAKTTYLQADEKTRKVLRGLFKGQVNLYDKITDIVISIRDAFEFEGRDYDAFLEKCKQNGDEIDEIRYKEIKTYIRVLNEKWVPDWSNSSQRKYFIYMDWSSGVFSYAHYDDWCTHTNVGSRLCLKDEQLALHVIKNISNEYKEFFTIQ